jgi:hypothetical protein
MCSVGGATQSDEDQIPQITVQPNQKVNTKQVGSLQKKMMTRGGVS